MLLALFPFAPALAQLPRPITPKLMVCLYQFYDINLSTHQEFLFGYFKPSIGKLVAEKYPVDKCFWTAYPFACTEHSYFQAKQIEFLSFQRFRSYDMCHISQRTFKS